MRYFGTDGVRGRAGSELTAELAFRLGRAVAAVVGRGRVLVGRDTRSSGPALEAACSAGLAEAGCEVFSAGIIPSPAISHLVRRHRFRLGAVISASHNPPEDNGVKFYGPDGLKLPPELEARVEAELERPRPGGDLGTISPWDEGRARYLRFLRDALGRGWGTGLRVVLDCAHGATAPVAPEAFAAVGATVTTLGTEPDGKRINSTGVMNMGPLRELVLAEGADLGVAFDGDGDRALFVTPRGEVVEGDRLLAALAPRLLERGEITRPAVVFTVVANMGPEEYLRARGISVVRVPVGDRNVALRMREEGIEVGGEPSGHIVFSRFAPTGDGILTALYLARILVALETDLDALVRAVPLYPQVRLDIPAGDRKREVLEDPAVKGAIAAARAAVGRSGRVVVRPSGTQPVIRVLVESPNEDELRAAAAGIRHAIERALARRDPVGAEDEGP